MKFLIEKLIVRRLPGKQKPHQEPKATNINAVHDFLFKRGITGASMLFMQRKLNLKRHQVQTAIKGLRDNGVDVYYRDGRYHV